MKKSIGAKVFLMLAILTLDFVAALVVNLSALGSIGRINGELTGTYMRIEYYDGLAADAFQRIQLYANLSYIRQGTEEGISVNERLNTAVADLSSSMTNMEELCNQINDSTLQAAFAAWKDEALSFCEYGAAIYNAAIAGDYDTVLTMADNIKPVKTAVEEKKSSVH